MTACGCRPLERALCKVSQGIQCFLDFLLLNKDFENVRHVELDLRQLEMFWILFSQKRGLKQFCLLYGGQNLVNGKKVVVVLPAYNAAKPIKMTYEESPLAFVDYVVLVDDASWDGTHGSRASHQSNYSWKEHRVRRKTGDLL